MAERPDPHIAEYLASDTLHRMVHVSPTAAAPAHAGDELRLVLARQLQLTVRRRRRILVPQQLRPAPPLQRFALLGLI
jgi:hypothetical protein